MRKEQDYHNLIQRFGVRPSNAEFWSRTATARIDCCARIIRSNTDCTTKTAWRTVCPEFTA